MRNPLRLAGIFGIIISALIIGFMIIVSTTLFRNIDSIQSGGDIEAFQQKGNVILDYAKILLLAMFPLSIGFLNGFIVLGKKFNNTTITIAGRILIGFAVLGFVLAVGFYLTGNLIPESSSLQASDSFANILKNKALHLPIIGPILNIFGDAGFWPLLLLFISGGLTLKLILAIGLIRLKKNGVILSAWCGWFEIASILIRSLGPVAVILETIMFFKAAKKNKKLELN